MLMDCFWVSGELTSHIYTRLEMPPNKMSFEFLAYIMASLTETMENLSSGSTFKEISKTNFKQLSVPLPSIEVQRKIIKELSERQETINANKKFIEIHTQKIQDRISKVWGE